MNWAKVAHVLLALWFLATGLIQLLNLTFQGVDVIMAVVAIIVGLLLLVTR